MFGVKFYIPTGSWHSGLGSSHHGNFTDLRGLNPSTPTGTISPQQTVQTVQQTSKLYSHLQCGLEVTTNDFGDHET